jgi:hypothetical protein
LAISERESINSRKRISPEPLTKAANSAIIGSSNREKSGKIGDTTQMTIITEIKFIDFNDKTAVEKEINDFAEEYAYADIEYALEISSDGKVYSLAGTKSNVNSEIIGKESLLGSVGIHNHIVEKGLDRYDSFSIYDLKYASKNKTSKQYLISGERHNAFEFTKYITEEEIDIVWQSAKNIVYEKSSIGDIDLDFWEQEAILRVLNDTLEGFEFYENF